MTTPDHLQHLTDWAAADVVATTVAQFGRAMPIAVSAELETFCEDPTRHNARRLANACERAGAIGLAAAIDVHLAPEVVP